MLKMTQEQPPAESKTDKKANNTEPDTPPKTQPPAQEAGEASPSHEKKTSTRQDGHLADQPADRPVTEKDKQREASLERPRRTKGSHISVQQKRKSGQTGKNDQSTATFPTPDSSSEGSGNETSSDTDEVAAKGKTSKVAKTTAKVKKNSAEACCSATDFSDSNCEHGRLKARAGEKARKAIKCDSSDDDNDDDDDIGILRAEMNVLKLRVSKMKAASKQTKAPSSDGKTKIESESDAVRPTARTSHRKSTKAGAQIYMRVDEVFDKKQHTDVIKPSSEKKEDEYGNYAFLVRRRFHWNGEYRDTVIDIKSKVLREVLRPVMKNSSKTVSLDVEEPEISPKVLFMYLEDLRTHYRKSLRAAIRTTRKRKEIKELNIALSTCRALVGYLDTDFADTKKQLYPLIESRKIDFDLVWGLFKPGQVITTSCYGVWDEPWCMQFQGIQKNKSIKRGEWYTVSGRSLDYDGKTFGWADVEVDIAEYKGYRSITGLEVYPLEYHKDPVVVEKQIIERGRQFMALISEGSPMQYKYLKGLAFQKDKKGRVAKINVDGRIMVDPATFRRICPNYSLVKVKEPKDVVDSSDSSDSSDQSSSCSSGRSRPSETKSLQNENNGDDRIPEPTVLDAYNADESQTHATQTLQDGSIARQKFEASDYDLLMTPSTVPGFSFGDKEWLEFTVSGIKDIEYNDTAFDSLMLPEKQKDIVRALVQSHKLDSAKAIDDVVAGKGKGLVSVLHGPPGVGKTLTAEGIAELLRCPLYAVSAGELSTDPARLEVKLQIFLCTVFLEKRDTRDVQRNALVSIFLRLLEYFQGILFLTTNRVDTFDEAFQSRIHLPLRYAELTAKAKKSVWKTFFDAVRKADSAASIADFSDHDLDMLSRRQLNGRQIKNAALALREGKVLQMEHIKNVLDVNEEYSRDLKGGTGYTDAMRSYT
ncbi:hypothetical protein LTR53_009918 [Teratosphaeriaceae sp. CCFEE 6253]|nr:hypothetical protein LTR53_009918 [Teratosphaeriaceae sp. CCFEE 6253]